MRSRIEEATDFSCCTTVDLSSRLSAYRAAGNYFAGEDLDHLDIEAFERRLYTLSYEKPVVLHIDARHLDENERLSALSLAVTFLHGWRGMTVVLLVEPGQALSTSGVTDASKLTHSFWS